MATPCCSRCSAQLPTPPVRSAKLFRVASNYLKPDCNTFLARHDPGRRIGPDSRRTHMTTRSLAIVLVAAGAIAFTTDVAAQGRPFPIPPGRVVTAPRGGALTTPSTASSRAILMQYLREQGRDEQTAQSLVDV